MKARVFTLFSIAVLLLFLVACGSSGNGPGDGSGDGPNILSFSASPATITAGGQSTLSWSVENADSLSLSASVGSAPDISGVMNNEVVVTPSATTTYTLTAVSGSEEDTATTTVTVTTGGGGGGGGTDEATKYGYITVDENKDDSGDSVSAFASFIEFDTAIPTFDPSNPYAGLTDSCEVSTFGGGGDIPTLPPYFPEITFDYLDAGEQLTFEAGASTYATLDKESLTVGQETFVFYDSGDTSLASPLPTGLSVDIPGAEFPSFTDAALPTVASFTLTAPADPSSVTASTTFGWTGSGTDSVVSISVLSTDLTTTETTIVSCIAEDDGSFAFPAETQAELGAGFSGTLSDAGRQAFRSETKGDATLLLVASSTQNFSFLPTFPTTP